MQAAALPAELGCERRVEEVPVTPGAALPAGVLESDRPVVLRGLVSHWPSVVAARGDDAQVFAYLRRFLRDRDILAFRGPAAEGGRFFYNRDLTGFNFERVTAALGSLLGQLEQESEGEGAPHLYVGSTSVDEYFPGFRQENDLDLGPLQPVVSIWMGNRSRIAAHFDAPANVACAVAGRRRFTLFPPDQLPNLYVGPIDFTPAGQAISLVDFAAPDLQRFPRFREAAAAAQVAELAAGDALFIPSLWWHHVEALADFNILVNYWWNTGRSAGGNPLNALVYALMCLGDLPPAQRAAWRGIFDYYVFSGDKDSLAHIPQQRLGVLGDMDEATLRQLRALLRNRLAG
jgi:hypothetical protein